MKVEYAKRAVADLREISATCRQVFGDRVAEALEARIRTVIDRISQEPHRAPAVERVRASTSLPSFATPLRSSIACSMIG